MHSCLTVYTINVCIHVLLFIVFRFQEPCVCIHVLLFASKSTHVFIFYCLNALPKLRVNRVQFFVPEVVNIMWVVLPTNWFVSTGTNSMKYFVNWIPQRIHVHSREIPNPTLKKFQVDWNSHQPYPLSSARSLTSLILSELQSCAFMSLIEVFVFVETAIFLTMLFMFYCQTL